MGLSVIFTIVMSLLASGLDLLRRTAMKWFVESWRGRERRKVAAAITVSDFRVRGIGGGPYSPILRLQFSVRNGGVSEVTLRGVCIHLFDRNAVVPLVSLSALPLANNPLIKVDRELLGSGGGRTEVSAEFVPPPWFWFNNRGPGLSVGSSHLTFSSKWGGLQVSIGSDSILVERDEAERNREAMLVEMKRLLGLL